MSIHHSVVPLQDSWLPDTAPTDRHSGEGPMAPSSSPDLLADERRHGSPIANTRKA